MRMTLMTITMVMGSIAGLVLAGCAVDAEMSPGAYYSSSDGNASYEQQEPGAYYPEYGASADASASAPPEMPEEGPLDPTAPDDGDDYDAPGTNPFVFASDDPFSTFGVDVDTASYDIFRRNIQLYESLPDPRSVRLEEYVNYFPYDYEAPSSDSEIPFTIDLEAAPSPYAETTLLRVGIKGMEAPEEEPKPANVVFLIDVSGSMSSVTKLPLVKTVLNETLSILAPTDTVSIVTYASGVGVRLAPTQVSEAATISEAINALSAGGATNGAGGIQLAYEQAQAAFIEGGINHVVLCTDGDFNVGASSSDALVELIEEKRKTGITLTVLGFGTGNLNDAMMEAVSNAGNGVYGVIATDDQAVAYVHQRMLSNLHFIAKDMKIQVHFNPEIVFAYRLLGYENNAIADEDFTNDAVDAGEIGAGHTVTALYELVFEGQSIPEAEGAPLATDGTDYVGDLEILPEHMAMVRVRYKAVEATEEDPARQVELGIATEAIADTTESASGDFQWAVSVAAFAELLKESPYASYPVLPRIQTMLEAQVGDDAERAEFLELFGTASGLIVTPGTL